MKILDALVDLIKCDLLGHIPTQVFFGFTTGSGQDSFLYCDRCKRLLINKDKEEKWRLK